jgi:homocitrate synthase NifV
MPEDVRCALDNCPGLQHLTVSASCSDVMIEAKFQGRKTWGTILDQAVRSIHLAQERGIETIGVGAEDASRADLSRLIEFAHAARESGATRFRYADTVGIGDPFSTYDRIREIVVATRMPVEMHCHNDLGMAVGASLAGVKAADDAGVDAFINTTVNGYGERAGNADLVSTLLALKHAQGFRLRNMLDEHSNLKAAWKLAQYASYAFGLPIPINQPGVGDNAFAHESGIHADGALKDSASYELFGPDVVGRGETLLRETGRIITTGAYGGVKGVRHVYERLGIGFAGDEEARRILDLVQHANLHTQKPLTDDELRFLANYPAIAARILSITP